MEETYVEFKDQNNTAHSSFLPSDCAYLVTNSAQFSLCSLNEKQKRLSLKRGWPCKNFESQYLEVFQVSRAPKSPESWSTWKEWTIKGCPEPLSPPTPTSVIFQDDYEEVNIDPNPQQPIWFLSSGTLPILLKEIPTPDKSKTIHMLIIFSFITLNSKSNIWFISEKNVSK